MNTQKDSLTGISGGLNIALIGYGKMGKEIEKIALQRGHRIDLKIDIDNVDSFIPDNLQRCQVAIEFTGPHSAASNILKCLDASVPVVSGSTGWLENWKEIENKCREKQGSFVYASNFSVGVNIFFEVNKLLARLMKQYPEYDVLLEETHHTQKKDAPSGTAITLAEQVLKELLWKKTWVNHLPDDKSDLPILSRRIDPAPGTHTVRYSSIVDDLEITHTAHNRTGFATGAVLAAEFIYNKKGIFGIKEVLGL